MLRQIRGGIKVADRRRLPGGGLSRRCQLPTCIAAAGMLNFDIMSVPREQPPFDPYHTWLGIPPDQQPANRYRLLGLELFESDADVIDVAANRQVAYLRQVGVGDHQSVAKQLIEEIAAARRFLLDTPSREAYDQQFQAATSTPPIRDRSPSIVIDASSPRAAKTESHRRSSKPQPDRSTRRKRQRTIMMSGAAVLTAIVVVGGGYLASRDTPAAGSIPRTADRSGAVAAQPVVSDTRSARPAPQRSASTNVSSSNTSSISEAFDRKFQAAQQAALAPQKPPTAKPVAAAKPKSDVARAKTDLSSESPLPIVVDFESDSWRDALTIDATEAFDKHHLVRDGKLLVLQSDDTSFYGAAMRLRVAALRPGILSLSKHVFPKDLRRTAVSYCRSLTFV